MVYLESPSVDPAFNLALEQYVFDCLPRSEEYFMLWQNDNAVIVGKHQNTAAEVNEAYVRANGIKVVRRLSGGGAVYHDLGNINYTFIRNQIKGEGLDFRVFCQPLVKALASLGVTAEVAGRNDVAIQGQKISGCGQYLKEGRVMHHGTILFDSDLGVLAKALNPPKGKLESKGIQSVRSRVTNIRPYLSKDISLQDFRAVLKENMTAAQAMESRPLAQEDLSEILALKTGRYDTWDWNYGLSPKYSVQKERRVEGCGGIQICMSVEGGAITAFSTHGDYFGLGCTRELADVVLGCPPERKALLAALSSLDIGRHYYGLTAEKLAEIILE